MYTHFCQHGLVVLACWVITGLVKISVCVRADDYTFQPTHFSCAGHIGQMELDMLLCIKTSTNIAWLIAGLL